MKTLPEIDPEVRGLLEEIVADPRSSIRLVPRRPLKSWFDSGERLNPREVSATKAERHLIEAHREALAQLLYEGAMIAFWKEANPYLHRPTGADGDLFDEAKAEGPWRGRATRVLTCRSSETAAELLRRCVLGVPSGMFMSLAQASLCLVPRDATRCYIALSLQRTSPRAASRLFGKIASHQNSSDLRSVILGGMGATYCSLGSYSRARDAYRAANAIAPARTCPVLYAFNLSCFLGDENGAKLEARKIDQLVEPGDKRLLEVASVLRVWSKSIGSTALKRRNITASRIAQSSSLTVRQLSQVIQS